MAGEVLKAKPTFAEAQVGEVWRALPDEAEIATHLSDWADSVGKVGMTRFELATPSTPC